MGDESYKSIDDFDEKSRLLQTHPQSSVYSPVGVPNTILEPPNVYKSRWRSIRVMYLTMFLSSVSFSICMSSIWPYLQLVDSSATTDLLGWVVASYSLGQLIASPLFGMWANCRNKSREPLLVSILINVLANVLYAYTESVPSHKSIALIIARAFIGFGAGNVAVVRSYVSGATTTKERTAAMANMSAFQAIGFIFGPSIQTAMVPIGYPGAVDKVGFHLDMYTMPAWLSAFVGIINIVLIIVVFQEHRVTNDEDINFSIQNSSSQLDYLPDRVAVVACVILFFFILFIFAIFETIGTPLTMHMFSWTKSQATLYNGIILAVGAVISIITFIVLKFLSRRMNERHLLLVGLIFCLVGFVVYLPWGHNYPDYQIDKLVPGERNNSEFINVTTPSYLTTVHGTSHSNITSHVTIPYHVTISGHVTNSDHATISDFRTSVPANDHTEKNILDILRNTTNKHVDNGTDSKESVGCPDTYAWCAYTPRLNLVQFLFGTLCIVIGYPISNVMTYTLYSKILGPKPQGTMMGWLTASGSLARTLGPIFVSQVYNAFGPRVTFVAMAGVILFTILAFLGIFKRLVPFQFSQNIQTQT